MQLKKEGKVGVTRTWTYICDVCTLTVFSDSGSLPKGWVRLFRRTPDGAKDGTKHCCSCGCAMDILEDWQEGG